MKKKILLVGGCGFIGHNLALELKKKGHEPYVVDSLGWAYYKLQDYDNAVRELEKAVSLKPTDPIINDHLGDAYEKKERILVAYIQWKKALDFKPEDKLKKQIEMKLKNFTKNSSINFKN